MKEVTKTYTVYEFNELSEEAKEKAFNWLYGDIVEDRFTFFEEDCYNILDEVYGIKPSRLHYSFSNSQGDGLSFDCDNLISGKVLDLIKASDKVSQATKDNIIRLQDALEVKTLNESRYTYHHRNQVNVYLSNDYDGLVPDFIMDDIRKAFEDVYIKIAKELEDNGHRFNNVTLEDVAEYAEIMTLDFYINGDIFNE